MISPVQDQPLRLKLLTHCTLDADLREFTIMAGFVRLSAGGRKGPKFPSPRYARSGADSP